MNKDKLQELAREAYEKAKNKERRIIKLHCLPSAIKQSIKDLREMSEDENMKNLFEDIGVLVDWALDRLPLVPPKKEDGQVS